MDGDERGFHDRMDGQANDVYQVQKNYGGIHYYRPNGTRRIPSQVPGPTGNFVNQVGPLALADQVLPAVLRRNGPHSAVFYGLPGSGRRASVRVWIDRHIETFPDGRFYADLSAGAGQVGLESEKLRDFLVEVGYEPTAIPESLDGRAALGNHEMQALTGIQEGFAYLHLEEAEQARAIFSAALVAARATDDERIRATALESLGLAYLALEQPAEVCFRVPALSNARPFANRSGRRRPSSMILSVSTRWLHVRSSGANHAGGR